VKSVQNGVRCHAVGAVETVPMVLHTREGIWRWIGKAWPQGGVWPAAVVMR